MPKPRPTLLACLLLAAVPCAQQQGAPLTGTYRVGKTEGDTSTGPRFQDLKTALTALESRGMGGPVILQLLPGEHEAGLILGGIPGLSEKRPLQILGQPIHEPLRSLPGARLDPKGAKVVLRAKGAPIFTLVAGIEHLSLAGLHFAGSESSGAILCENVVSDIEIRDCVFSKELQQAQNKGAIYVEGKSKAAAWHIHHNSVRTQGGNAAFYFSKVGRFDIHDNHFELQGLSSGLYFINKNDAYNRIHRNLIVGDAHRGIHVAASNLGNRVLQNIILLKRDGAWAVESFGTQSHHNRIYGNLLLSVDGGGIMMSHKNLMNIQGDGNVFASSKDWTGSLDRNNGGITSLKEWREASQGFPLGEMEQHGRQVTAAQFAPHMHLLAVLEHGRLPEGVKPTAVLRLLGQQNLGLMRLAIAALGRLGREGRMAIGPLVGLLRHPDAFVRADAAEALGRIRFGAEIAVPDLTRLLDDKDHKVVQAAARSLAYLQPMSQMAVPRLRELLQGEDEDHGTTQAILARALAQIAPERPKQDKAGAEDKGR